MKIPLFTLLIALVMAPFAWAADTAYSTANSLPPANFSLRYPTYPPFLFNPTTGRLLVEDSGSGSSSTNAFITGGTNYTRMLNDIAPVTNAIGDYLEVAPRIGSGAGMVATNTAAYAASLVVKASAGTLLSISGYNAKTSRQFIQVHNTTSLPADTAVPMLVLIVEATNNFARDFPTYGFPLGTGITVCNSSTGPTKTIGSADCWFTAVYK